MQKLQKNGGAIENGISEDYILKMRNIKTWGALFLNLKTTTTHFIKINFILSSFFRITDSLFWTTLGMFTHALLQQVEMFKQISNFYGRLSTCKLIKLIYSFILASYLTHHSVSFWACARMAD